MKKYLALLLSLFVVLLAMAGCNNTTDPSSTPSTQPSSAPQVSASPDVTDDKTFDFPLFSEPKTFTLFAYLDSGATTIETAAENLFYQKMAEMTNITFKFQHPPANGISEAFNLMIASNDYSNVIRGFYNNYTAGVDNGIAQGIIYSLNDYQDYLPNMFAAIGDDNNIKKQVISDEGNYWGIPNLLSTEQGAWGGPVVRQDLLLELGIESPVTFTDWEAMLTTFRDNIPGMENGPLAMAPFGFSYVCSLQAGYNLPNGNSGWLNKDGVAAFGPLEPSYKEYITMVSDWYSKKLIDQEFNTKMNYIQAVAEMANGTVAVSDSTYDMTTFTNAFTDANDSYILVAIPQPVKNKGDIPHTRQSQSVIRPGNSEVISTSVDPADVPALLKYYDYMFTEEGALLANWGVEGLTFTYENGRPVYTKLITKNPDGLTFLGAHAVYLGGRNMAGIYEWTREVNDKALETMDAWNVAKNDWVFPEGVTRTAEEGARYSTIMGDIQTLISEKVTSFITGGTPMSEYDAFIEQIKAMNIDEVIQIQ